MSDNNTATSTWRSCDAGYIAGVGAESWLTLQGEVWVGPLDKDGTMGDVTASHVRRSLGE